MNIKAHFEKIKEEIINEINNSKKTIWVALAYFTDSEIFNLLCYHAEQGKNVEIILSNDDINLATSSFDFHKLIASGGKCYVHNNESNSLMHHKFAIIDDETVITGSYNWTVKAQTNSENIVVITENSIAKMFVDEFIKLKKSSQDKFDYFKNLQASFSIHGEQQVTYPTAYPDLDKIIFGFTSSELTIIAGRKAMGTTSLMLNFVTNIVNQETSIALFSLDLKTNSIVERLLDICLYTNELESENSESDFEQCANWLEEQPIYIDDTPVLTVEDLRNKIIKLSENFNAKIVFVDNLDYLRVSDKRFTEKNKFQEEFNNELIVKELKILARMLNISIVLLVQLPKSIEQRIGSRPELTDLSGNIDNYADKIIFVYRPERYGITEDVEGNSAVGMAEIIVLRNQSGNSGDIKLRFISEQAKFVDYDQSGLDPFPANFDMNIERVTYDSKMDEDAPF